MNTPPNLPPYGVELWNAAQACVKPPATQNEYCQVQARLAHFKDLCSPSRLIGLLRELAPAAHQKSISVSTPVNNPAPMSEDHKSRRIERLETLLKGMLTVYDELVASQNREYGVVTSTRAEVAGLSHSGQEPMEPDLSAALRAEMARFSPVGQELARKTALNNRALQDAVEALSFPKSADRIAFLDELGSTDPEREEACRKKIKELSDVAHGPVYGGTKVCDHCKRLHPREEECSGK